MAILICTTCAPYGNSCISCSLDVFQEILTVNACTRSVRKALSIVLKEDVKTLNVLCLRLIQLTIGKEGALNV